MVFFSVSMMFRSVLLNLTNNDASPGLVLQMQRPNASTQENNKKIRAKNKIMMFIKDYLKFKSQRRYLAVKKEQLAKNFMDCNSKSPDLSPIFRWNLQLLELTSDIKQTPAQSIVATRSPFPSKSIPVTLFSKANKGYYISVVRNNKERNKMGKAATTFHDSILRVPTCFS